MLQCQQQHNKSDSRCKMKKPKGRTSCCQRTRAKTSLLQRWL